MKKIGTPLGKGIRFFNSYPSWMKAAESLLERDDLDRFDVTYTRRGDVDVHIVEDEKGRCIGWFIQDYGDFETHGGLSDPSDGGKIYKTPTAFRTEYERLLRKEQHRRVDR